MEDYSIKEQFAIFYNAKKIIAAHGSAFTNIVCSRKDKTAILDIIHSIRYEDVYRDMSRTIGIKYIEYIESNENNFVYYGHSNKNNDFDMKVDIKSLMPYVDEIESLKL